jgi:hypothetical protein
MSLDLHRIRFQETWGEQFGEYLEETVTSNELQDLLQKYATEWFPEGHTLSQDPDSPNTWRLTETTGQQRHVYLFIEPIG